MDLTKSNRCKSLYITFIVKSHIVSGHTHDYLICGMSLLNLSSKVYGSNTMRKNVLGLSSYTSPTLRLVFYDYREVAMDGWTKGGIEVVYWSVPSFQHTIYPPKSPSLFSLLLLPLISFSCRCSQYYFKRLMVACNTLHQFPADCPCLVGVKARRK